MGVDMNKLLKLAGFLKAARDSDLIYIDLIKKIIESFKSSSILVVIEDHYISYKIDLRKIKNDSDIDLLGAGDYMYLDIYHPLGDDREESNRGFRAIFYAPSRISFYLTELEFAFFAGKNLPGDLIDKFSALFSHEVVHFLNNLRFLPLDNSGVARYESLNYGPESFGYANSTEEVQARILSIYYIVMDNLLDKNPFGSLSEAYHKKWLAIYNGAPGNKLDKFLAELVFYVYENDLNSFLNHILFNSKSLYIGKDILLEKTRKRYLKRLYDLFQILRSNL